MINKLRGFFGYSTNYVITGAPQCPLSDAFFQMKDMIVGAQFDILWIQFYNNPSCDGVNGGFNFDDWVAFLRGTKSSHAKLYIGLPGSPAAAGSGYLDEAALKAILDKYATRPAFGGVMLWDAYFGTENKAESNTPYVEVVRSILATVSASTSTTSTAPTSQPSSCTNTYLVTSDKEYCYAIAEEYHITVQDILDYNPDLNEYCDIHPGLVLCLPSGATTSTSSTTAAPTSTAVCTEYYTVVSGDWCSKIADAHGITLDQLRALNPQLDAQCAIFPGQKLCVSDSPSTATTTSTSATATATLSCVEDYTVVAGDYCYKIAEDHGLTLDEFLAMNPTVDCALLQVGQVVCTKQGTASTTSTSTTSSATATSTAACTKTYTVAGGDYCYKIAEDHGLTLDEFLALNPTLDCSLLDIGQTVCVSSTETTSSTTSETSTTATETSTTSDVSTTETSTTEYDTTTTSETSTGDYSATTTTDAYDTTTTSDSYETTTTDSYETSTTDVYETSTTDTYETSTTDTYETSTTDTYETSTTDSYETSTTDSYETSTTDSYETTTTDSYETSTTDAYETSTTDAYETSTIDTYETSTTDSYETSTTEAYETSTTDAYETSTTDAYETSTTDAYEATTTSDSYETSTTDSYDTTATDSYETSTADSYETSTTDSYQTSTTDSYETKTSDSYETSTADSYETTTTSGSYYETSTADSYETSETYVPTYTDSTAVYETKSDMETGYPTSKTSLYYPTEPSTYAPYETSSKYDASSTTCTKDQTSKGGPYDSTSTYAPYDTYATYPASSSKYVSYGYGASDSYAVSSSTCTKDKTGKAGYYPTSTEDEYTISTVYATSVYTVKTCYQSVSDCPELGKTTTTYIPLSTTKCTKGKNGATAGPYPTYTDNSYPTGNSYPTYGDNSYPTTSKVSYGYDASVASYDDYTTSTIYATNVYTVATCYLDVKDCPEMGKTTTSYYAMSTTVCAKSTSSAAMSGYTTSTVYATNVYTMSTCGGYATDCPEKGSVTTEMYPLYTTVCPIETAKAKPTGYESGDKETYVPGGVKYAPESGDDEESGSHYEPEQESYPTGGSDYSGSKPEGSDYSGSKPEGSDYSGSKPAGSDYSGSKPEGSDYSGSKPESGAHPTGDYKPATPTTLAQYPTGKSNGTAPAGTGTACSGKGCASPTKYATAAAGKPVLSAGVLVGAALLAVLA
jgi:chitinase